MSMPDEDKPRKPAAHEIGCDLSMLSIDELKARMELLRAEISRIEAECTRKSTGRQAAENLFRNP